MADRNGKTWEDHWAEGHIPWDAGRASPSLKRIASETRILPGARALVPGCGSGYDVFRLAHAGYQSVGIDLAPSAQKRFSELRAHNALDESRAALVIKDFFTLSVDDLGGPFDFIWDYTFYCAINPEQRDAWREQMAHLLTPDGTLAMLLFPVVDGAPGDQGPPYPLNPECVTEQLSPRFRRVGLEKVTESHPGREGKEWLSIWEKIPAGE